MVKGSSQQSVPWGLRLVLGKDFQTAMGNMFKDLREITARELKNDYDSNGTECNLLTDRNCVCYTQLTERRLD